jgi:hypothetical protein
VDDRTWWRLPDLAWWVKLGRAGEHIGALDAEVSEFLEGGGYRIEEEPGQPHETVYRLLLTRPVPLHLSTIIGDTLHNLRSALDCVAFELARRHVGRDLTEGEESATEFPVSGTHEWFERFFTRRGRDALYGPREREAMGSVQPGAHHDLAVQFGATPSDTREEAVKWDSLWVLNRLSNIDKHRKLHVTVAWPDLVHWGSDGPSHRRWRYGTPPFDDVPSSAISPTTRTIPSHRP